MSLLQSLRQQAALGKKLGALKLVVRQGGVSRTVPLTFSDGDAVVSIDLDGGASLGAGGSSTAGEGGGGEPAITQVVTSGTTVVLDGSGPVVTVCTPGASLTVTTANLSATVERTLFIEPTSVDVPLTFPAGWRWVGYGVGQAPAARLANRLGVVTIYSTATTDDSVVASWDTQL